MLALLAAVEQSAPTDLLGLLTAAGAPTLLAIFVVGFWKEWWVPGTRYRKTEVERDELQKAVIDKVIPAVTEANVTLRQISQLIQTDVSIRDRRPE